MIILLFQARYHERMEATYRVDPSAHLVLDHDAYLFAAGEANRGKCFDYGLQLIGSLHLLGWPGIYHRSSQESMDTPSIDDHMSHAATHTPCPAPPPPTHTEYDDALLGRIATMANCWGQMDERYSQTQEREAKIQRRIEEIAIRTREDLLE